MVETRIAPRYRVSKPAQIDHGGDKTPCIVRDLSTTGAALEFSDPCAGVPAAFTLIVREDKLKLPCRVVWRTGFRMGAAFDQRASIERPMRPHSRLARGDRHCVKFW